MEKIENKIEKEKGANIELILHVMRHGDRTPEGFLEDYGRERTKNVATKETEKYDSEFKIKAFGSPAGPKSKETEMERSLETAHVFANSVAENTGANIYTSRPMSLLNYEDWDVLTVDPGYDYDAIYNQALEKYSKQHCNKRKYEELSKEEQKKASFYASQKATEYYLTLNTEAAKKSRKEVAGTFAVLIKHYIRMMKKKLNSNQKFLFPLGSHTGMMESFLAETVIWTDEQGKERRGATLKEMGGILKPSEGFDIVLKTDQNGKLEQVQIRFDDQTRLGGKVYLDMRKIDEFAKFYRELHKEERI